MTRFVIAIVVMVGALMFLGCPLRMMLRVGGGDLNALIGLVGFIAGIFVALGGFLPSVAGHDLSLSSRASRRWGGIPRPMRWRLAVGITAGIVVLAFTGFIPALLLVPALWWWQRKRVRQSSAWRDVVDAHLLPPLLDSSRR